MVSDKMLEIEIDDIYFLTGLSHRGGSGESMDSYVNDLCIEGTHKQGRKLPI